MRWMLCLLPPWPMNQSLNEMLSRFLRWMVVWWWWCGGGGGGGVVVWWWCGGGVVVVVVERGSGAAGHHAEAALWDPAPCTVLPTP
jgi:hypothetical protein